MRAQKPREESDESEWSGQKRDRDRANRKKTRKIPSYDRTETFGVCPFGDDPNGRDARGTVAKVRALCAVRYLPQEYCTCMMTRDIFKVHLQGDSSTEFKIYT